MCVDKMVEYAFGKLSQQGRKTVDYHPAVIRYLEVSDRRDRTFPMCTQREYLSQQVHTSCNAFCFFFCTTLASWVC